MGCTPRVGHGPRRASASGRLQMSRMRSRTVRACVPSQAQAVARRSSHRHRTPAVGANGRNASAGSVFLYPGKEKASDWALEACWHFAL
jgi:hypothetical protein